MINQDSFGKRVWIGALALVLGLGLLALIWLFARVFAIVILSIAISAALAPVVAILSKKLPRIVAMIIVYLVLILILVGLGWLLFPPLISQAADLVQDIPTRVEELEQLLRSAGIDFDQSTLLDVAASQISRIGSMIVSLPMAVVSSVLDFLLLIFISFYGLLEAPRIRRFLRSLFPDEQRQDIIQVLENMTEAMGGYVRGAVISGLIVGLVTFLGLLIIGVEYAVVLGVLAGALELVPVIGATVAGIVIVILTLINTPEKALMVLVFVIVLQQFESNILTPNIMHRQADISPLLTIIVLFAGGTIGGLLGALVAIPLAAALKVLVIEVVAPAVRRASGKIDPIE